MIRLCFQPLQERLSLQRLDEFKSLLFTDTCYTLRKFTAQLILVTQVDKFKWADFKGYSVPQECNHSRGRQPDQPGFLWTDATLFALEKSDNNPHEGPGEKGECRFDYLFLQSRYCLL